MLIFTLCLLFALSAGQLILLFYLFSGKPSGMSLKEVKHALYLHPALKRAFLNTDAALRSHPGGDNRSLPEWREAKTVRGDLKKFSEYI